MKFRVACAQFAPTKGEVDQNLSKIAEIIAQASEEGCDLLLLPETCTSGYFLEGGVLESSMEAECLASRLDERLKKRSRKQIEVALGFYENAFGNLFNSAAHLEIDSDSCRLKGVYRKFFLPTYGVFDEERFVSRGRDLCVIDTRLGKVALLICEDVWHGIMPTLCAVNGAQIILVPAASPARGFSGPDIDNHDRYRRLFRAIAEEHGVFCLNAQLCGFEGGKGFTGGSMIVDPMGNVLVEAPLREEHLLVAEIDTDLVGVARAQSPLLSDLQSVWEEVRRLVRQSDF